MLKRRVAQLLAAMLCVAAPACATTTLTITGATYSSTAPKFGAQSLSGGTGYSSLYLDSSTSYTLEAWVRTSNTSSSLQAAVGRGVAGYIGSLSGLAVGNIGSGTFIGPSIADGAWHHEAIVCAAGVGSFYVDGAPVSGAAATCPVIPNYGIAIGSEDGAGTFPWTGGIAEVAFFNYPRYQGSFTPPVAAYAGTEIGLLQLFHLQGDSVDYTGSPSLPVVRVTTPATSTQGALMPVYGGYGVSSGTPTFKYSIDGGSSTAVTPSLAGTTLKFNITGPPNGSHSIALTMTTAGVPITSTSGTFITANGHILTLVSPTYGTSSCKFGSGCLTGGYGTTTALSSTSPYWTIEAWARMPAANAMTPGALQIAVARGPGFIGIAGNALAASAGGSTFINGPTIADGTWHHVALSCANGSAQLFLDGGFVGASSCAAMTAGSAIVGSLQGNASYAWSGSLDEVAFWSSARYAGSFTAPVAAYAGTEVGLDALYHLDGNAADSIGTPAAPTLAVANPGQLVKAGATFNVYGSWSVTSGTPTWSYTLDGGASVAVTPNLYGAAFEIPIVAPGAGSHTIVVQMVSTSTLTSSTGSFQTVVGLPLSMVGATYSATGTKFGTGYTLTGGYGQVTLPSLGSNWTLEEWVKSPVQHELNIAASSNGTGFYFGMDGNGFSYASLTTSTSVSSNVHLDDGAWHHLALVSNNGVEYWYTDGVLLGSGAAGAPGLTFNIGTLLSSFSPWNASIDQAALWNYAKYVGTSFVVPSAALTGNEPGLLNLWNFDAQNGNDTASPTAATAAALTIATPPNNTLTGAPIVLTGSYNGTAPTGINVSTDGLNTSVPLSGFATVNGTWSGTYTTSTTPGSVVLTVQEASSLGVTAVSAPFTIAGAVTFTPDNAAFYYSPFNWTPVVAGETSSINPGAYIRTVFSGNGCTLKFDVTNNLAPLSQIYWRVDGASGTGWQEATLAPTIPCPVPAMTATAITHSLDVVFKSQSAVINRWGPNSATAVTFAGLSLDTGGSIQAPSVAPCTMLFSGDSITEGTRTVSLISANDVDQNDATTGWAWYVGQASGCEFGIIGFGSTGVQQAGAGGVPNWQTSWNLIMSGVTRPFPPCPNAWVVNEGTNDNGLDQGVEQTDYLAMMNLIFAACPGTKVISMLPFRGYSKAALVAAAATISATNNPNFVQLPTDQLFNPAQGTFDGLHPSSANDMSFIGPQVWSLIKPIVSTFSGRSYSFH